MQKYNAYIIILLLITIIKQKSYNINALLHHIIQLKVTPLVKVWPTLCGKENFLNHSIVGLQGSSGPCVALCLAQPHSSWASFVAYLCAILGVGF